MKKLIFKAAFIAVLCAGFVSCDDNDDDNGPKRSELYATNTASGNVTAYNLAGTTVTTQTFAGISTSNEGVVYDAATDQLLVASRSNDNVNVFTNVFAQLTGAAALTPPTVSTVNLNSPRAVAISGNLVVVADTGANEFIIYTRNGANLTFRNKVTVTFPVWGIEFIGNDLYAVVDMSSDLAVFNNFGANATNVTLQPSKRVTVQGIVRTHGIKYSAQDNLLIMTDVGAATDPTDGAFHLINNFSSVINNTANAGTIALSSQTRVAGAATLMGNPVAVDYDANNNVVFIAEAANGGGRILSFNNASAGGNIAPTINNTLAGANAVSFYSN